ncbi:hypothetical protein D3C86_1409910 [compost metagenome]
MARRVSNPRVRVQKTTGIRAASRSSVGARTAGAWPPPGKASTSPSIPPASNSSSASGSNPAWTTTMGTTGRPAPRVSLGLDVASRVTIRTRPSQTQPNGPIGSDEKADGPNVRTLRTSDAAWISSASTTRTPSPCADGLAAV